MCCNYSGPNRTERMKINDALEYIKQAAEIGINAICITGGEPFLYFEDIINIMSFCNNKNIILTCLTNAFWATDNKEAQRIIEKCKESGLSGICISTSDYHQKFVPLDRVKRCIEVSLDNNLKVELRVLIGSNTLKLKQYKEILDISVKNNFSLKEYPISRVGRGSIMDISEIINTSIDSNCSSIFKTPVIEPNGDIYACCGIGYKTKPLLVGNLNRQSLSNLLSSMSNNLLYYTISSFGPYSISKMVQENGQELKLDNIHTGICHLCNNLLMDENNLKLVWNMLKSRSTEIVAVGESMKSINESSFQNIEKM